MLLIKSVMAESLVPHLRWYIVNDSVMGGISNSKMTIEQNEMSFTGQLSLANNGGFASVRAQLMQDMGEQQQISFKVKGDGRVYQFRLRTSDKMDGIAYKVEFKTKGNNKWQQFDFNANDFVASFRGRILSNAPRLKFADVSQLGFLIADKNLSPFKLIISDISVSK
jgi:NADH dehydrogenase [ubiquinone] 1 alpha subcomplex assembly factor 1